MWKYECRLCLRDNRVCKINKSFLEILRGQVEDCSIYEEYHEGLEKLPKDVQKYRRNKKKNKEKVILKNAV